VELMKRMDQLKELWRCENQSSPGISTTVASSSCKKVLSSVKVTCKGRPRTKRNAVVIEIVVKKSKVSSQPPRDNNAKTKRRKIQVSIFFVCPPFTYLKTCVLPAHCIDHFLIVGLQINGKSRQHLSISIAFCSS
jgi:hypothetical protein